MFYKLNRILAFYGGVMPSNHFDIWFNHFMRVNRLSIQDYAYYIARDEVLIAAISNGSAQPDAAILESVGLRREGMSYVCNSKKQTKL